MACCPSSPASPTSAASSGADLAASTSSARTALPTLPAGTALLHLHLQVSDLDATVAFYTRFLGAAPVKRKAGYAKFLPTWAPLNLALSEHQHGPLGSIVSHVGMQVASVEELQAQAARIRAAGTDVREEMGVTCCFARQDKFWVHDPAGMAWEVYVLHADEEEDANLAPGATACCGR